ncbi:MAG: LacI family DNA-binding transcriptional regulator, partial [Anaerolineaceae bacterium]|nr:LacI family DNA-binding transcriptional regulator [Anaerolineaceae bacterium]
MTIKKRISIKDIARAAGVSYSTVSRALNNSTLISEPVRLRIQELARELGYVPDSLAQSLHSRLTHSVGVVFPTISDNFFVDVIRGIEDAAHDSNFSVFLSTSNNDPERELRVIE